LEKSKYKNSSKKTKDKINPGVLAKKKKKRNSHEIGACITDLEIGKK
jgi:hypothetical protein